MIAVLLHALGYLWLASTLLIIAWATWDETVGRARRLSRRPPRRHVHIWVCAMSPSPISYRFQACDDDVAVAALIASLKSEVRHG